MLRRLYDWTLSLSAHPHAIWVLAAIAFIESSVFPIPPDVLIIPMVLAAPKQAWRIATVATLASVIGGYAGYGIGAFLYDGIGQSLVAFYGYEARFEAFQQAYNEWGAWIVAGAGLTPFPYKVITIASGVTALDPWIFGIASVLSRGARFFLVAGLLFYFGPPIRIFIERHLGKLTVIFFVLLLGGFVAVKYLS
ncbi:MAG: YqaA family protein [Kiloniellales bacterium]|nr:YqaA family protein [Kiloniellales bacterium]